MPGLVSNTVQVHVASKNEVTGEFNFLVLKRSEGELLYPSIWQVVTGCIDTGETALEAALRELKEETSLFPDKIWTLPYIGTFFNPTLDELNFSPAFGILVDDKEHVKISEEHQDFKWLNLEDCIELIFMHSQKEGTQIFWDYILSKPDSNSFLINKYARFITNY